MKVSLDLLKLKNTFGLLNLSFVEEIYFHNIDNATCRKCLRCKHLLSLLWQDISIFCFQQSKEKKQMLLWWHAREEGLLQNQTL